MSFFPQMIETLTSTYAEENEIQDISTAFEKMTTDLILKNYNPAPDDLDDGNVDGKMDGGIDGFYIFVDEQYIKDDEDFTPDNIRHNPKIDIFLIQNKYSKGMKEEPLIKLCNAAERILNDKDDMMGNAEPVRNKVKLFREVWNSLLKKMPTVTLSLIYVSNSDPDNDYPSVYRLAKLKQENLQEKYRRSININVQLINSFDIYNLHQSNASYSKELAFEDAISTDHAYIITTTLDEYFKFITIEPVPDSPMGERTKIADHLFDDNVRHYQGEVTVNKEISATLRDDNSGEFWWLNNGITIICTDARTKGKKIHLKDIQIVNGLQTSYCIFNTKIANPTDTNYSNRRILVRVIETEDASVADRIIKATNSQNPMKRWSLHATDPIQRLIEEYFKTKKLYYDRRKGYHKNNKRPASKIVSINYVGQCMIAMGLSQPDTARARPNSFLGKEEQYETVFDDTLDLELFYVVTALQKRVESAIRSNPDHKDHYTNIRFHVSSFLCTYLAKTRLANPADLGPIVQDILNIDDDLMTLAIETTISLLKERSDSSGLDLARVAKSKEFREDVLNRAILESDPMLS